MTKATVVPLLAVALFSLGACGGEDYVEPAGISSPDALLQPGDFNPKPVGGLSRPKILSPGSPASMCAGLEDSLLLDDGYKVQIASYDGVNRDPDGTNPALSGDRVESALFTADRDHAADLAKVAATVKSCAEPGKVELLSLGGGTFGYRVTDRDGRVEGQRAYAVVTGGIVAVNIVTFADHTPTVTLKDLLPTAVKNADQATR